MDPNATLALIAAAIGIEDYTAADAACADLYEWIESGGFLPDFKAHKRARNYYSLFATAQRAAARLIR